MKKVNEIDVRGTLVRILKIDGHDFVCITDIAHLKSDDPAATISNWMRNRMTLEYLGLWEELYNPTFNPLGFEGFVPGREHHLYVEPNGEYALYETEMLPSPAAAPDIRAFAFERNGRQTVAYWHMRGEGEFTVDLGDGAKTRPVDGIRYLETSLSRAELRKAWAAAR